MKQDKILSYSLSLQRKEIIIVVGMEEIREAAWRRGYLNWALKTR